MIQLDSIIQEIKSHLIDKKKVAYVLDMVDTYSKDENQNLSKAFDDLKMLPRPSSRARSISRSRERDSSSGFKYRARTRAGSTSSSRTSSRAVSPDISHLGSEDEEDA